MKIFRVTITADRYPTEYSVQATNWGTAVNRAIREWKQSRVGKGSRTEELRIHAVKGGKLLQE